MTCIVAVAGGLTLGLSGCGDDSSSSSTTEATTSTTVTATTQDQANAAFCASLVDLQAAVTDVKNLDPNTVSVSSLTSTVTTLTTALSQLTAGAKDAVGVDSSQLQSAFTQLKNELAAIPGSGQGIAGGIAAVQATLPPVQDALNDVKPDCPTTGGTTTG